MEHKESSHIETRAVHAGVTPDPSTGAIMTPIFQTSTYVQASPGQNLGYEYSRTHNPTRTALQNSLAALEKGKYGLATASGCSATDIILHSLEAGDHVICADDVYGGTSRLFRMVWAKHGVSTTFVDMTRNSIADYVKPTTKLIWIETPTNPLLKIIDIAKVAETASRLKPRPVVVVDNTFATPYFQTPLDLGADVVLHSTSKYLNGHSDVVGGAIVTNHEELHKKYHYLQNAAGGCPSPFDAWLVLRGVKTLALRMKRHAENAHEVASFLEKHPAVEKVLFPGLPSHPQHDLAKRQMRGYSGMVTFFIKGEMRNARTFLENLKVFALAESLGGVESLVDHPAIMTHASIPPETRKELGITDTLVRLSVGIEHVEDLKHDLDQALKTALR